MPLKDGLIYHLTCLLYVLYPEYHKFSSKGASFWVSCILFVHNFR